MRCEEGKFGRERNLLGAVHEVRRSDSQAARIMMRNQAAAEWRYPRIDWISPGLLCSQALQEKLS